MQAGGMRTGARARMLVVGAAVAVAAVSGCGGTKASAPPGPRLVDTLPKVAAADGLAPADVRMPPVLVYLDANGVLAVADGVGPAQPVDAAHWTKLAARDGRAQAKVVDATLLAALAGLRDRGLPLAERMKAVAAGVDLTAVEDPPPEEEPEEEPEDDDGAEESGGTGTMVMLDEGKMGKKISDREEGQYKMQRLEEQRQEARDRAIAAARAAGVLSAQVREHGFGFGRSGGRSPPTDVVDPRLPHRLGEVVGEVRDRGAPAPADMLILPAAHARAQALIDVLGVTRGLIAVSHQDTLRVLRLEIPRAGYGDYVDPSPSWLEVRVGADALELEAPPSVPVRVAWPAGGGDAAALKQTYDAVRAAHGLTGRPDVDLLVAADTDVQRLVEILVALDVAGARVIGLGGSPTGEELGKRGKGVPRARLGQPQAVGDLDKAEIRKVMRASRAAFEGCYTTALASQPELTGTVATQFFISPNGTVAVANASGVTAAVAACVAKIIKGLEFPKPKGGGGVQVNYPVTFAN